MGNVTKDNTKKKYTGKKPNKGSKRKFDSRSNNRKDQDKVREELDEAKRMNGANDPMWYAQSPQLLKDAGSFSFNAALGADITLKGDSNCKEYTGSIPGIMSFNVAPVFGTALDWSSSVNIAARRFYTFIRHANSGHANYDAPNLMMYLMAVDSVYSLIAHMNRIYGLLQVYSIKNRYYPASIAKSIGVNFNSFMQNAADFRYFMNQYTVKAASLCVPADFTFYRRHVQLYENVYLDAPNDKAQTYVFRPEFVYKYVVGTTHGSNRLEPVFLDEDLDFYSLRAIAEDVLNSILVQEDMNIMSGDILKAYGREGLYSLAQVPENYVLQVSYNPEIIMQIHNATIFSISHTDLATWKVEENTSAGAAQGCLKSTFIIPANGTNNAWAYYDKIIDVHVDSPTPDDVMVATRLTVIGSQHDTNKIMLDVCGSEIITECNIWALDNKTGGVTKLPFSNVFFTAEACGNWMYFHDAPILYAISQDLDTQKYQVNKLLGEIDNYTVIGERELRRLHETALTSMLTAPTMTGLMAK